MLSLPSGKPLRAALIWSRRRHPPHWFSGFGGRSDSTAAAPGRRPDCTVSAHVAPRRLRGDAARPGHESPPAQGPRRQPPHGAARLPPASARRGYAGQGAASAAALRLHALRMFSGTCARSRLSWRPRVPDGDADKDAGAPGTQGRSPQGVPATPDPALPSPAPPRREPAPHSHSPLRETSLPGPVPGPPDHFRARARPRHGCACAGPARRA